MTRTFIAGTRGSRLALTQTGMALDLLREANPGVTIETRVIQTQGDRSTFVLIARRAGRAARATGGVRRGP